MFELYLKLIYQKNKQRIFLQQQQQQQQIKLRIFEILNIVLLEILINGKKKILFMKRSSDA